MKKHIGVILVFLSTILFASYGVWSVLIGPEFGVFFQGYVRSLMILIFLVPVAIFARSFTKIERKDYPNFLLFLFFVILTQAPLYYAYQNAGIGISTLVFFSSYLIASYVVGKVLIGETLTTVKLVSFVLAMVGLVSIFYTSLGIFSIFALSMAALNGIASGSEVAVTKLIPEKYNTLQTTILAWLAILVTHLPLSFIFNERQVPLALDIHWFAMLCFAFAGGVSFFLVIVGYKYIDASVGGLIGLLEIIFSIILGVILFSEVLTSNIILGAIIILIAAALPNLKPLQNGKNLV